MGGNIGMIKRILAVGLAFFAILTLNGCGIVNGLIKDPAKEKSRNQYECGKSAYDSLVRSEEICIQMMDSIYNAWRFSIYEATDYSGNSRVAAFADEAGLTVNEVKTAFMHVHGAFDFDLVAEALTEFSYAVDIVLQAYIDKGLVTELDGELENAKAELKTMTEKYSDYDEYPMLKTYYSKVNSYAEFVKNPTGSFEQLVTTIETYEKEMRDCRGDLEFVFED